MDERENPYASPLTPPPEPTPEPKRVGVGAALLYAFETLLGLGIALIIVWQVGEEAFAWPSIPLNLLAIFVNVLALPAAVAMFFWAWGQRENGWASVVANVLGATPFFLAMIAVITGLLN